MFWQSTSVGTRERERERESEQSHVGRGGWNCEELGSSSWGSAQTVSSLDTAGHSAPDITVSPPHTQIELWIQRNSKRSESSQLTVDNS